MTVVRTVVVPVDPSEAFRLFTDEIDDWYERGPHSWNDPARAVGIRFENGRLVELWDDGGRYEMGRVIAWVPGRRLAFVYRSVQLPLDDTVVEVRFEDAPAGTRVTLEHRGLERLPPDHRARWEERAWARLMDVFGAHARAWRGGLR
jgi:hypothetical protein